MKMLIGILVVAILSIIFTLQNVSVVQTRALFWTFESPLALIIAVSLVSGIVLGILISIYTFVIKKSKSDKSEQKIKMGQESVKLQNSDRDQKTNGQISQSNFKSL
jgi:uncharacterized integral membrane protein